MTNAADIVTTTIGGRTFRCSRRTEAHLLWTVERLSADFPDAELVILQGAYNVGVAASAGTHDRDAVIDCAIRGLDWRLAQRWLREHGWACWYRYPPTFSEHLHMVSLGYPGEVGVYVPGQVRDYYAGRNGLAGHAADPTWRPADIDASVFDYPAWLEENEMKPEDFDRIRLIVREEAVDAVDKALDAELNINAPDGDARFRGWSVRRALKALLTKTGAVK